MGEFYSALKSEQAVPIINKSDFSCIKVATPALNEQNKIGCTISVIDKDIDKLNMLLFSFRKTKKGLMQKLLSGNVRVKV